MEQNGYVGLSNRSVNSDRREISGYDVVYLQRWCKLVRSPLYLIFVITFMVAEVYTIVSILAAGSDSIQLLRGMLILQGVSPEKASLFFLVVMMVLCAPWILLTVGFWLIRTKAGRVNGNKTTGVSILFWVHSVALILVGVCFVITLPMFTEWFEYNKAYSIPLQIVYVVYILLSVYLMIVIACIKKVRDNLALWDGSKGPLVTLAVVYILSGLILLIISGAVAVIKPMTGLIGGLIFVPMVLATILIFKYRKIVLKP